MSRRTRSGSVTTTPARDRNGDFDIQRRLGNQAVLQIQTKLRVSTPGDPAEREADHAADQLLASSPVGPIRGARPLVQPDTNWSAGVSDAVPAGVGRTLASPARPLDAPVRADMERHLGHDFSRVRVHTDSASAQSAGRWMPARTRLV